MAKANTLPFDQENFSGHSHHHLVCWKSVAGGVLITLLGFMILTALGAGIAGFTAESLINHEEGGSTLFSGAGLWLGLSAVISLFCGGYFAVRISRFQTNRIGAAHGFVVAAIFFLLLMLGAGKLIGSAAQGIGKIAQGAGESASAVSSNPAVQDTINKAIGGSTATKSDPRDVAQGIAVRLLQGDVDSAKAYYAYQTGLPQAEVDSKFAQMKNDFDAAVKRAGEKTAHAVGDAGWAFFVILLIGTIASVLGGRTAAHSNVSRPFIRPETATPAFAGLSNQRGSVVPYLFGWLLGVPVSILFLIAILRSIF